LKNLQNIIITHDSFYGLIWLAFSGFTGYIEKKGEIKLGSFGLTEIVILFLIILILFGAKRIPDLFRAVGSSMKNFKSGISDDEGEDKQNEPDKS